MVAVLLIPILIAQDTSSVQKELDANYSTMTALYKKGDISGIGKFLTDDFTVTRGQTVSKKADVLKSYQGLTSMTKNVSWPRKITALSLKGELAIATVDGHFKSTMAGPDQKDHSFELIATTIDTWTKTTKGYRLLKSVVTSNVIKVDGKEQASS